MAPTPLHCTVQDCEYTTPVGCPTWELMTKQLEVHSLAVHPPPGGVGGQPRVTHNAKLESLPRPTFSLGMTESKWQFTNMQWEAYIAQTSASTDQQVQQLRAACDKELLQRVYDCGSFASLNTTAMFLSKMKELAVITVHKTIHMVHLWKMTQESDERIRAFAARVSGKADLCEMTIDCPNLTCDTKVPYRDEVVLQVLLQGMSDKDIRARTLTQTANGKLKKLSEVIEYVAAEEAGILQSQDICHDNAGIGGLHKSAYKRGDNQSYARDKCGYCGDKPHGERNSAKQRETSCKAWNVKCNKCQRLHHFASVCRSSKTASTAAADTDSSTAESSGIGYLGSLTTTPPTSHAHLAPLIANLRQSTAGPITTIPLPHQIHSIADGWKKHKPASAPVLPVSVSLDKAAYGSLSLPPPRLLQRSKPGHSPGQRAVFDTGAQIVVVPVQLLHHLAIPENSVFPIATSIKAVNAAPVDIIGGVLLKFSAANTRTGKSRVTRQLAYVSKTVPAIYLSQEACIDLGTISPTFPQIGEYDDSTNDNTAELDEITAAHCAIYGLPKCSNSGVVNPGDTPCQCPTRALPPSDRPVLPCAPIPENLQQLKQFILERFKGSAFNCCEHQVLPLMTDSPPLRLHIDPQATPTAVYTPSAVPRHWVQDVKNGLDRDERLGVIEKVPVNAPVTWTSRMVVTPKTDGSPRRVIDFQAVNTHAPRQTHHTRSPWAIASSIPAGKCKTVLDNWHGYHSVPLHPADREVTTFLTQWGRYRYRTCPQGLNSAGDGYTQRSDIIMEGVTDHDKCIDDSILWTDDIEQNFYKVCDFLTRCSNAGMVFNPSKFQFSEQEVDYLGFKITATGIKPQDEFLQSIRDFPPPRNLTDVRSWFGMINQISYTYAVAPAMAPFRHLLSAKIPFHWSEELQTAFEASKEEIVKQCMQGVRSFSLTAPTALATDWSHLAMGFWLTQKTCNCTGPIKPGCCKQGWQTVYCGSTFNTPAEARYHPVEGEACAVKKGLEKCKIFLLGHPNLIVCVDHKPLLAIMGDQELADIPNPRLLDFKIKSLAYRFQPIHIPGKLHVTPDALSRRSDSPIAVSKQTLKPKKDILDSMANNVQPAYSTTFGPPSWVSTPTAAVLSTSELYEVATREVNMTELDNTALLAPVVATQPTAEDIFAADQLESLIFGRVLAHIAAIKHGDEVEALTWERLEAACLATPEYKLLHRTVQQGISNNSKDWDLQIQPFFRHRTSLSTLGPVVLLYDKPIIPRCLKQEVMEHLHAAHGCANMMFSRAAASLYWPNYREDINKYQSDCRTCRRISPSNPSLPPTTEPDLPSYPFESVVADFFSLQGKNYLAMADRYSNWLALLKLTTDSSTHLIQALREYSTYFGIPRKLSSDGASIFTSTETDTFCKRWGITQRISSSYYPQSNKRAEIAVKSCKRMVRDNLKPDGSLDGDKFARALLVHRNTPDPATGVSPAQIVFGRQIRDHLPTPLHKLNLNSDWTKAAKLREECFMKRHYAKCEDLTSKTKQLQPLIPGDHVYVQDQNGNTPRQWNKSGKVLEALPHDSYLIRIDGSYTTTRRNRKFLRLFTPYTDLQKTAQSTTPYNFNSTLPLPPTESSNTTNPAPLLTLQDTHVPVQAQQYHQPHLPVQVDDLPQQHVYTPHSPAVTNDDVQQEQHVSPNSTPDTVKPKPKHLRERWIVAQPKPDDFPAAQSPQMDQISAAAKTFVQACLEVLQLNLADASIGRGGIART